MNTVYQYLIAFFKKKILFIYSWETQREREAEIQAEGEAVSSQEAQSRTGSLDLGSHAELKAALNRWATQAALEYTSKKNLK